MKCWLSEIGFVQDFPTWLEFYHQSESRGLCYHWAYLLLQVEDAHFNLKLCHLFSLMRRIFFLTQIPATSCLRPGQDHPYPEPCAWRDTCTHKLWEAKSLYLLSFKSYLGVRGQGRLVPGKWKGYFHRGMQDCAKIPRPEDAVVTWGRSSTNQWKAASVSPQGSGQKTRVGRGKQFPFHLALDWGKSESAFV